MVCLAVGAVEMPLAPGTTRTLKSPPYYWFILGATVVMATETGTSNYSNPDHLIQPTIKFFWELALANAAETATLLATILQTLVKCFLPSIFAVN